MLLRAFSESTMSCSTQVAHQSVLVVLALHSRNQIRSDGPMPLKGQAYLFKKDLKEIKPGNILSTPVKDERYLLRRKSKHYGENRLCLSCPMTSAWLVWCPIFVLWVQNALGFTLD
jgi:hypothetical protein